MSEQVNRIVETILPDFLKYIEKLENEEFIEEEWKKSISTLPKEDDEEFHNVN